MSVPAIPRFSDLAGRTAVVTGGSRGIGAAVCRLLADHGVRVGIAGRDADALDEVVADVRARGAEGIALRADVTDPHELERIRSEAATALGEVSLLVLAAGGPGPMGAVLDTDPQTWREVVDANLTSTFLTLRAFAPGMVERRRGSIVTVASLAARQTEPGLPASYTAAKAGVIHLTRQVAHELGPQRVRVNCVSPASTLTERADQRYSLERRAELAAMSPLGSLGLPDDSAIAALFLLSDASRWITGATIDVAGGRVMR